MSNRIALGRREELTHRDTLKASLAEFISTFIFVFAGQGSGAAFDKLTRDAPAPAPAPAPATSLVAASLAHGFGVIVAISVGANISGGHVNPAVTFGVFVGGHISFFRGIMYWVAQLLGSIAACYLLRLVTGGHIGSSFALSNGVSYGNGVVLEIVMTFGLVYTVYATAIDAKKGKIGTIAPLVVGSYVAANILLGGTFTGACMNPAVAIGPSLVRWDWTDHWVYWVGPLIGGGLAGVVYQLFFISQTYQQLPND